LIRYGSEIQPFLFTRKVEIDCNVIPFSHPVLTLNCNYLENDEKQLSNFLREHLHWFVVTRARWLERAIKDFRDCFPQVPVGGKKGARDVYSTYLHLIVCDLELLALTQVLGKEGAREIVSQWTHYTWIYDKVLHDKRIEAINIKHGFVVPQKAARPVVGV
jgi:hypothetical protein